PTPSVAPLHAGAADHRHHPGAAGGPGAVARPGPDVAVADPGGGLVDRRARLQRRLRLPPHRSGQASPGHRHRRGADGRIPGGPGDYPADRHDPGPAAAGRRLRPGGFPDRLRRADPDPAAGHHRDAGQPPPAASADGRGRRAGAALAGGVPRRPLALCRIGLGVARRSAVGFRRTNQLHGGSMSFTLALGGTGQFGSPFAELFAAHPDIEAVYAVDSVPDRIDALEAKGMRFAGRFDTFEELLASDVDAIAVFTQRWTHGEHALAALRAG